MEITGLTIRELSEKLAKGEVTSVEATKAYLARIQKVDPEIHAFLTVTEKSALSEAAESDERRKNGQALSDLDGVPMGLYYFMRSKMAEERKIEDPEVARWLQNSEARRQRMAERLGVPTPSSPEEADPDTTTIEGKLASARKKLEAAKKLAAEVKNNTTGGETSEIPPQE